MNLYDFEKQHKRELESIDTWPYLRIPFGDSIHNETIQSSDAERKKQWFFRHFAKTRNVFYGFSNWFKRYDYMFFSSSNVRGDVDGKMYDRFCDDAIQRLGSNKSLLVELPVQSHFDRRITYTKNIVSQVPIEIFGFILQFFTFGKERQSFAGIRKVLIEKNIDFPFESIERRFLGRYMIYHLLLRWYKPEILFVVCHYDRFPLIKAANDLGIKIIEFQHGVIGEAHYGYRSELNLDTSYYPEILLSFGSNEKKLTNFLIQKIIPIGSYYLEYMLKNFQTDSNLEMIKDNYKYTVGVSMQDEDWERSELLSFLQECAEYASDTLFILIPRRRRDLPHGLPNNLIPYDKIDCYRVIMHCDAHCTLYSSCALEAPSLGIPNILVDVSGTSSNYYENILSSVHTQFVCNKKDFFSAREMFLLLDKETIMENNRDIFEIGYTDKLQKLVDGLKYTTGDTDDKE